MRTSRVFICVGWAWRGGAAGRVGEEVTLKREVGWFGSFSLGYADVGADIFIALGLIAAYAAGVTPIVFLIVSVIYVTIGLAYAELAPSYPYAGGVHVYALKGFNDLAGFIAGWALLMSYTLCITLFALAAAGYLLYLVPWLGIIGSLTGLPTLGLLSAILIAGLIIVNYIGIRYSVGALVALVIVGLIIQGVVLLLGYSLSFDMGLFLEQLGEVGAPDPMREVGYLPGIPLNEQNLLYALTLAMASFIGIESIAQAAEETRRPARWIPRAAKLSVLAVVLSVMGFSILALGVMGWEELAANIENPIASLVSRFPLVGGALTPVVAAAGFVLCYASSNTGVIGVSRLVASMGRFRLLPSWFYKIHPLFRTPTRAIVVFGVIGLLIAFPGDIPMVAELYNYGALISYQVLMLSLIRLRNLERDIYRPWVMPGTIRIGRGLEVPLLGAVGLAGTMTLFALTLLLHPSGRVFGTLWMILGVILYILYRRRIGLPPNAALMRDEVAAISHIYDVGLLVRPIDDERTIVGSVLRALDRRFRITLLSIIEPRKLALDPATAKGSIELERLSSETLRDLERIAQMLRRRGYQVDARVYVGDLEKVVEAQLEKGRLDFIAVIRRFTGKARVERAGEDGLLKIISKYPGRVMVLRRVS